MNSHLNHQDNNENNNIKENNEQQLEEQEVGYFEEGEQSSDAFRRTLIPRIRGPYISQGLHVL